MELAAAKVLAFGVLPAHRKVGIGRRLLDAALARATELDCHQLRSQRAGNNPKNHALKLEMGFAVHPILRGEDTGGVYFVMPLRAARAARSENDRPAGTMESFVV